MKKINFFIFALLFASLNLFSQATPSGSTLTVLDITGSQVYYEFNFTPTGGFISEFGPGAPLNVPIRIKLTSGSGAIPTFVAADMNGNCDTHQIGSMNSTQTEFITTLNSCCPSTAEIRLLNGLRFWILVKCAPVEDGAGCIKYNLSKSCDLSCISFSLPSNSAICRTKNYTVTIGFEDGTSTTIIVNFASNNTFFCFAKNINGIISSNLSNCKCSVGPQMKQIEVLDKSEIDDVNKIIVSPNPTNSFIKFDGKNLTTYKVAIFNCFGNQVIKDAKIDQQLNFEKYEKGIYIYVLTDENGYKQEGKIIKE